MKKKKLTIKEWLPTAVAGLIIFALWFFLSDKNIIPKFMLPSPVSVAKAFIDDYKILADHLFVTLKEALLGLGIGVISAVILSVIMDRFPIIYKAFFPILIVTQTIPSIAIAPLLILWMGFETAPKITLVAVTSFFPVAVNLLEGFKSADPDEINLLRSFGANRLQIYYYVKFPEALGHFFAGLKIATAYSVVSAVIAEWMGGFSGLGVYMTRVRKAFRVDKMFAVIILIAVISLLLILLVNILERILLRKDRLK